MCVRQTIRFAARRATRKHAAMISLHRQILLSTVSGCDHPPATTLSLCRLARENVLVREPLDGAEKRRSEVSVCQALGVVFVSAAGFRPESDAHAK
jgi:hypothetical protein